MAGILKVGLTGGIACGRSTAGKLLVRPGWLLIDADEIVHALLAEGGDAAGPVIDAFGTGVRSSSGGVDRRALGEMVFSDQEARRRLESIVHPMVYGVIDADTSSFERRCGSGVVIVDAALMVETGSWKRYHRLVVAHCPPEEQLRRLMKRDHLTADEARRRIAAQQPLERKIALADYTLDTGGTLEETRRLVTDLSRLLEEDLRALPALPPRPKSPPA